MIAETSGAAKAGRWIPDGVHCANRISDNVQRASASSPIAIHPPSNTAAERRPTSARRSARFTSVALVCVCLANVAAASPHADGWRHLVTDKVLACGIAAVALLVLSLLLRGLLKVITLALVAVLAAGVFWFLRDGLGTQSDLLPHAWTALAERTLDTPKARDAWKSVESELGHLSASARARLAAGTDDARRSVQAKLEAKARELRKEGSSVESEQIAHLAELVGRQK